MFFVMARDVYFQNVTLFIQDVFAPNSLGIGVLLSSLWYLSLPEAKVLVVIRASRTQTMFLPKWRQLWCVSLVGALPWTVGTAVILVHARVFNPWLPTVIVFFAYLCTLILWGMLIWALALLLRNRIIGSIVIILIALGHIFVRELSKGPFADWSPLLVGGWYHLTPWVKGGEFLLLAGILTGAILFMTERYEYR
ncbi:hypothetical protein L248_2692 [Schleiferilactobacillus shenzhenensis LY-73]|uniref:Uncharacterized protein n=2 Tax=Schleiferilactobacillus shenzhenensis TaxID=1231337 RepID=U4TTR9_9LACO|nr:hypothetical protein L248_2692 [Schleiferilactobacillus shenzhenensis LY-73]